MTSEWMKVMLEEIARKRAEAEQSRLEQERRADDMLKSGEWDARNKDGDAE